MPNQSLLAGVALEDAPKMRQSFISWGRIESSSSETDLARTATRRTHIGATLLDPLHSESALYG
jgi:hypothetical protein